MMSFHSKFTFSFIISWFPAWDWSGFTQVCSLLLPVDRIPSHTGNGKAQSMSIKPPFTWLCQEGLSHAAKISEDALTVFSSRDCIGLRRCLDEHSEVRWAHLTEVLNCKMVWHADPTLQTPSSTLDSFPWCSQEPTQTSRFQSSVQWSWLEKPVRHRSRMFQCIFLLGKPDPQLRLDLLSF